MVENRKILKNFKYGVKKVSFDVLVKKGFNNYKKKIRDYWYCISLK